MTKKRRYIKYDKASLERAVKKSVAYSDVFKHLGKEQAGGAQDHLKKKIALFEINTSHFLGQACSTGDRYKGGTPKKLWNEILVKNSKWGKKTLMIRRALIEMGREYCCENPECPVKREWLGNLITLQTHHIDGDGSNCLPENLLFLCPNCHSQTPNFGNNTGGTTLTSNANYSRAWRKKQRALKNSNSTEK